MTELKPCPFCGAKGVLRMSRFLWSKKEYRCECPLCNSISLSWNYDIDIAIKIWNTRVEPK